MSTLQVNTIQTNTASGVLAVRDANNALTAIQPGAVRSTSANTAPVFQTSTGTPIGTLCRAWVNFDGTGTVAIRAAFNVSSITDGGTGLYTVNFASAMPDTNYAVTSGSSQAGTTAQNDRFISSYPVSTSSCQIIFSAWTNGNTLLDGAVLAVAIFR